MRILIPSSSNFHSDFNAIKPKLHHYFKKIIFNLFNEINLIIFFQKIFLFIYLFIN